MAVAVPVRAAVRARVADSPELQWLFLLQSPARPLAARRPKRNSCLFLLHVIFPAWGSLAAGGQRGAASFFHPLSEGGGLAGRGDGVPAAWSTLGEPSRRRRPLRRRGGASSAPRSSARTERRLGRVPRPWICPSRSRDQVYSRPGFWENGRRAREVGGARIILEAATAHRTVRGIIVRFLR